MSPLAWDLGHIAAFEDLWVSREAGGELWREDLATVYDAFETPRAGRGDLRYLRHDELPDYLAAVRDRTRRAFDDVSPFIAEMLIQHEH
jgi:iron(II)-dependent oxidoreductase